MLVATALVLTTRAASAQLTYRSGQPVSAAYEGWEEDPDGSRHFLFGYMNSNWEETPDVSVGPDNYFVLGEPGTGGADPTAFDSEVADQGQPTHFLPRRNRFVFRVPVPEGFEETDEVIWTLTVNDETVSAYASLRLDYRVDNIIKASEQGAIGAGTTNPVIRANEVSGAQRRRRDDPHRPRGRTADAGRIRQRRRRAEDDGAGAEHRPVRQGCSRRPSRVAQAAQDHRRQRDRAPSVVVHLPRHRGR